jgi:hypothetical protein
LTIVMREIQLRLAAKALLEQAFRRSSEKFYKKEKSTKNTSPSAGFLWISSPAVIEQDLFSLSAPKARDAADNRVAHGVFLSGFHDSIRDEASNL